MDVLFSWLVLSFAIWVTAAILPGFHIKGFGTAILVAAVLGVLNFFLGWLFFAVFTIATLGLAYLFAFLTRWVITAILLMLTAGLTKNFKVDGFGSAFLGALIMALVGTGAQWVIHTLVSG